MTVYRFNSDVGNDNFKLKKSGTLIQRGEVIDYDPVPDRIHQLERIKVVEKVEQPIQDPKHGEDPQQPEDPPSIDEEKLQAVVDKNANDAIDEINDGNMTADELHALYALEEEQKNRSTVLKEIQSEIQDIQEKE